MASIVRLISITQRLKPKLSTFKSNIQVCRNMSKVVKSGEALAQENLPKKYFISYGFDDHDPVKDRAMMHACYFLFITCGIVLSGFLITYLPASTMKAWAEREAYLQIRYREEKGLPLVDPNYVDPEIILSQMPSDEELLKEGLNIII